MKKLLSLLLALTMVVSLTSVALAADDEKDSTASIVLEEGKFEVIDPEEIDPEDPDNPENPDGEFGDLKGKGMDMDFGTHKVTGRSVNYSTVNDEPVGLMVRDARGTANAKWNLSVAMTKFSTDAAKSNESLQGAYIELTKNGNVITSSGDPNLAIMEDVKGADGLTGATGSGSTTVAGAPKVIFKSHNSGSMGTWGGLWDAKIFIEGGRESVADHKATVVWTLGVVA